MGFLAACLAGTLFRFEQAVFFDLIGSRCDIVVYDIVKRGLISGGLLVHKQGENAHAIASLVPYRLRLRLGCYVRRLVDIRGRGR